MPLQNQPATRPVSAIRSATNRSREAKDRTFPSAAEAPRGRQHQRLPEPSTHSAPRSLPHNRAHASPVLSVHPPVLSEAKRSTATSDPYGIHTLPSSPQSPCPPLRPATGPRPAAPSRTGRRDRLSRPHPRRHRFARAPLNTPAGRSCSAAAEPGCCNRHPGDGCPSTTDNQADDGADLPSVRPLSGHHGARAILSGAQPPIRAAA